MSYLERKVRRWERHLAQTEKAGSIDFLRKRVTRLEHEMNTKLPDIASKVIEQLAKVENLLENLRSNGNCNNYDIINALSEAYHVKEYYRDYQSYLGMDNSSYNTLTDEFTQQRNLWNEASSDNRLISLRRQVIQATFSFLQKVKDDIQPREAIRLQGERWRSIIQELSDANQQPSDAKEPNYESKDWSEFAQKAFDHIVGQAQLNEGDSLLLGDILKGGKDARVKDRDSENYKRIMKITIKEYLNYLGDKEGWKKGIDKEVPKIDNKIETDKFIEIDFIEHAITKVEAEISPEKGLEGLKKEKEEALSKIRETEALSKIREQEREEKLKKAIESTKSLISRYEEVYLRFSVAKTAATVVTPPKPIDSN